MLEQELWGTLISWVKLSFFSLPGEASAVLAKAKAKAEAIRILASALTQHVRGRWVGMGGRNRQLKGSAHLPLWRVPDTVDSIKPDDMSFVLGFVYRFSRNLTFLFSLNL